MQNKKNNNIILLTFDYELFLYKSGTVENCLIKPTDLLIEYFNKFNIKATFFVDILFYNLISKRPDFSEQALLIKNQLQRLLKDGHRLELHLHPQWLNSKYEDNEWIFPIPIKYTLNSSMNYFQQ